MKNVKMLVWLTQLGLSVALPPLGFIYLAVRLQAKFGWGSWVIWAGVALGLLCAVEGFRGSLKAMELLDSNRNKEDPPVSFNNHD